MLRFGLQATNGAPLILSNNPRLRPRTEFLEEPYARFRSAR